ncbi:MAG: ATP-binding protein, partial [Bacteroidota bacterium]
TVEYPASFMLVASMNPCPCGYYNHPDKECVCTPGNIQRYMNKISGPLLDRIDIHIEVVPVSYEELSDVKPAESSDEIRERVNASRERQAQRFEKHNNIYSNAQMHSKMIRQYCEIDSAGKNLLKRAMDNVGLSARAYDRILKVSRTIADLEDSDAIQAHHLAEAINYRSLDRENWGS